MAKNKLLRMDNVGIVVENLKAAITFFIELGLELECETTVEGKWVDQVVGLDGVRSEIAMLRTPDGPAGLSYRSSRSPRRSARSSPSQQNTQGMCRIMFAVEDIEEVLARLKTHGASSAS